MRATDRLRSEGRCETACWGADRAVQPKTRHGRRYPVSNYQRMLLELASDPATSELYHEANIIRWALRISPALPERTMRRAFTALVERHDSLRLQFVRGPDDWEAEILASHPKGLVVKDVSDLAAAEQDAAIQAYAITPMTALSDCLFELVLFKCGQAGDVLMFRVQHAIIDGYSVAILIEDLLKIVLRTPFRGPAPSHGEFIARRLAAIEKNFDEKMSYWESRLLPIPEPLNLGRRAKGLPPLTLQNIGKFHTLQQILPSEIADGLDALARSSGISAYCYLYAAYCQTILELGNQEEVIVRSVISRLDSQMAAFVGAEVQAIFLKVGQREEPLDALANTFSEKLAEGLEYLPISMMGVHSKIREEYHAKEGTDCRFFVHIPNPTGRMSNSPFRKLFDEVGKGKLSLGALSIERFHLVNETGSDCELRLNLVHEDAVVNAELLGDREGYSIGDLESIALGIVKRVAEHCGTKT